MTEGKDKMNGIGDTTGITERDFEAMCRLMEDVVYRPCVNYCQHGNDALSAIYRQVKDYGKQHYGMSVKCFS